jgi:hypothetical protein
MSMNPSVTSSLYQNNSRLINADFPTFVGFYNQFEERLIEDLTILFTKQLESKGAIPKGKIVTIDGIPYHWVFEPVGFDRTFTIYLNPCGATRPRMKKGEITVGHFGRIRKIQIQWPDSLSREHESLLSLLYEKARQAYIALQVLFVSRYSELEDSLLSRLYDILDIHIKQAGRHDFVRRSWFTVTNTKSGRFQYYFSKDRLDHMLNVLISDQVNGFSPFELACCLIVEEASDGFFDYQIDLRRKLSSLPFVKLPSVHQEHKHWTAESRLYQDPEIAAKQIGLVKDCCLLINCPSQMAAEFENIVIIATPDLLNQFRNNVKDYFSLRNKLSKLMKPLRNSSTWTSLIEYSENVLSKTLVGLFESVTKP